MLISIWLCNNNDKYWYFHQRNRNFANSYVYRFKYTFTCSSLNTYGNTYAFTYIYSNSYTCS